MVNRDNSYIDLFRDLSKKVDDHHESNNARLDHINDSVNKLPGEILEHLGERLEKIEAQLIEQDKSLTKHDHYISIGTKIGIGVATAFTSVFMWLLHSVLGLEKPH
jgi:tetrahydromethanopterin S-methyltransferase subunit G